ncbi:MAG: hypothetical protein IPG45_34995 [Deltaproteobacteria bacterium]|nr:hypothetical protein [Deltaproteobacteria bacterium]
MIDRLGNLDLSALMLRLQAQGDTSAAAGGEPSLDPATLPKGLQDFIAQNPDTFEGMIDTKAEYDALLGAVQSGANGQATLPSGAANPLAGMNAEDIISLLSQLLQRANPNNNAGNGGGNGGGGGGGGGNGFGRALGNLSAGNNGGFSGSPQRTSWNPTATRGAGNDAQTTTRDAAATSEGPAPVATAAQAQNVEEMKARTPADLRARAEAVDPSQIPHYEKRSPEVQWAARVAVAMGLQVTDHTDGHPGDGIHSNSSHHYDENSADGQIHAVDIGGDHATMGRFFDTMAQINPGRELFFDPRGGLKNGESIGAIGGHGNHVHYAA